jgi:mannose-6-phosphate isomerase
MNTVKFIKKPWGHEEIWAHTDKYVGKILFIEAGKRLSLQYHNLKEETILVKDGKLLLEAGNSKDSLDQIVLNPGQTYHIPPKLLHRMSAINDTFVVEVSTPELDDVVRIEDDYGRSK